MGWQDLAACAGMDTDLFFPQENIGGPQKGKGISGEHERVKQALGVCRECPVRRECLLYAIELNCTGIWGGMDTAERRKYAADHDLI
jgi:WhiB family transcriptional regulator, redox-sensing transcriptional regulator